jgi:tyrosyl-tRNA synthetase
MSKSLNNYIGITESADDIYGKAMSISDELMWRYYDLVTDLTPTEIARLKSDVESGAAHPRDLKSNLAKKIVADFHSREAAGQAEAEFIRRFREHQAPTEVKTFALTPSGATMRIADLLVATAMAPSKAEARRLVSQGGVRLNGERIGEATTEIDTTAGREFQLQVGKLNFLRVVVS